MGYLRFCWRGCTRIVILIGPWAIKLPRVDHGWHNFLRGLLGNMQEREFGATGWPELCPVVLSAPGGWLTVMRRATPLSDRAWGAFDFTAFSERDDRYGSRVVPVENKRDSFGILCGEIVAVDYGS